MFKDIYKGYKHLYSKGLAHRNLTPSNIFLKDGECKIADFGMTSNEAKFELKSAHGDFKKSPYHNTEDVKSGVLKPRCDIYSLGVILYELFHRKLPFETSKMKTVVFDDIPASAEDLIKKCLGLEGNSLMSIEEFSSHSYINEILYGSAPSNLMLKEDFRSIPLTKV